MGIFNMTKRKIIEQKQLAQYAYLQDEKASKFRSSSSAIYDAKLQRPPPCFETFFL